MEDNTTFTMTKGTKVKMALLFPVFMGVMFIILALAVLFMNVRNIGRWINLFGEVMVGRTTYYKDLWPMTGGELLAAYKEWFNLGS